MGHVSSWPSFPQSDQRVSRCPLALTSTSLDQRDQVELVSRVLIAQPYIVLLASSERHRESPSYKGLKWHPNYINSANPDTVIIEADSAVNIDWFSDSQLESMLWSRQTHGWPHAEALSYSPPKFNCMPLVFLSISLTVSLKWSWICLLKLIEREMYGCETELV